MGVIVDDSMLATIDTLRGLADTVGGLRLYTVSVVVETWPDARPGFTGSAPTRTITPLTVANGTARPKVVRVSQANVILSGGLREDLDLRVGPFTPPYHDASGNPSTNGTAVAIWNPAKAAKGQTVRFLVQSAQEFPTGAMFKLISYEVQRATSYFMTIRKTSEPVPT